MAADHRREGVVEHASASQMSSACVYRPCLGLLPKQIAAEDRHQAMRPIAQEQIDLLFAHTVMPSLDGVVLARIAKPLRPSVRIAFLTGYCSSVSGALRLGNCWRSPVGDDTSWVSGVSPMGVCRISDAEIRMSLLDQTRLCGAELDSRSELFDFVSAAL
jgi:hypothetical protein